MVNKREDNKINNNKEEIKENGGIKDEYKNKNGVVNNAFETDEKLESNKRIENMLSSQAGVDSKDVIEQSQIEIGFTESMLCTSKL